MSIFTQESTPLPQRESIFAPSVVTNTVPSSRIFNSKSFIPQGEELENEAKKILAVLRFGSDTSEKFLTFDRAVMEPFHHEHTLLLKVLYREEFSHSRTLMNRLLAIVEEGETKPSFFTFWAKSHPKVRATEIQNILTALDVYDKKIAASRLKLEHRLEIFATLKQTLYHYQNVARYLLEKGNYTVVTYPEEIRVILIHKIATLQEAINDSDSGHDIRMLKMYLLHFSLVVEELKIRYAPVLITLAHEHLSLNGELKTNMIHTLKGFLGDLR